LEEWHGDGRYDPADDDDKDKLEEGDRILYTVFTPVEEIRAGSTASQRLAEAHTWNSTLSRTEVLPWAADFSDIFNREFLTLCQKDGHGIMPSNLSRMPSRLNAKST
jgi:hypothetical protein